ncbi:CRISPR-associated protein Cas6 [Kyrpidia tusciae DSM 2912]|uniref:CRISPR-associated protein Cas6 n=1 Tax=Kyrpidia tusciae (strain DSM 2912 / NBRC 15312 / T2) TaxID=562970 RepID=D5WUC6_KYRT2|nr:CRISPR-associated protein Cas6 [Kyrpidia tusciae DSM 2912]
MRLVLTMRPSSGRDDFVLPLTYNEYVQAALYHILPEDFAAFLHDEGYSYLKRKFRMFSFSRLLGKYEVLRDQGLIRFFGPVRLVVVSPLAEFTHAVLDRLLGDAMLRLGNVELELAEVESSNPKVQSSRILVQTLSPITAYSTLFKPDGRKYTVYFHPRESSFSEVVRENLRKKVKVARDEIGIEIGFPEEDFAFDIRPVGRTKKSVVVYRDVFVQGYSGRFELTGPPAVLSLALDFSLGSKNSQGFGCVDLIKTYTEEGGDVHVDREPYSAG